MTVSTPLEVTTPPPKKYYYKCKYYFRIRSNETIGSFYSIGVTTGVDLGMDITSTTLFSKGFVI